MKEVTQLLGRALRKQGLKMINFVNDTTIEIPYNGGLWEIEIRKSPRKY